MTDKIDLITDKNVSLTKSEEQSSREDKITLLNIDNVKTFSQNIKIIDIKKKFKKSLYDKRIRYGRLCNLGIANQNLRFNKHFNIEEMKSEYSDSKTFSELENSSEIKNKTNDSTDVDQLKINLKGNFRDELEKIFYDPKFNINIRPDTRELNLLQMLKQKINKLNSLD